jgi:hypothetical protein
MDEISSRLWMSFRFEQIFETLKLISENDKKFIR